ncbi:MAG: hypothetical protein U0105_26950 [Candidatus Obscuribacterales bacterium]
MKKATAAVSICGLLAAGASGAVAESDSRYVSPYAINFEIPLDELLAPDSHAPRNEAALQSEIVPVNQWYSDATRRRYGTWGPPARTYPQLSNHATASLAWQQQRLLAEASKYINL